MGGMFVKCSVHPTSVRAGKNCGDILCREPVQAAVLAASRMTSQRTRGSAGARVLDAAGAKCQAQLCRRASYLMIRA